MSAKPPQDDGGDWWEANPQSPESASDNAEDSGKRWPGVRGVPLGYGATIPDVPNYPEGEGGYQYGDNPAGYGSNDPTDPLDYWPQDESGSAGQSDRRNTAEDNSAYGVAAGLGASAGWAGANGAADSWQYSADHNEYEETDLNPTQYGYAGGGGADYAGYGHSGPSHPTGGGFVTRPRDYAGPSSGMGYAGGYGGAGAGVGAAGIGFGTLSMWVVIAILFAVLGGLGWWAYASNARDSADNSASSSQAGGTGTGSGGSGKAGSSGKSGGSGSADASDANTKFPGNAGGFTNKPGSDEPISKYDFCNATWRFYEDSGKEIQRQYTNCRSSSVGGHYYEVDAVAIYFADMNGDGDKDVIVKNKYLPDTPGADQPSYAYFVWVWDSSQGTVRQVGQFGLNRMCPGNDDELSIVGSKITHDATKFGAQCQIRGKNTKFYQVSGQSLVEQ